MLVKQIGSTGGGAAPPVLSDGDLLLGAASGSTNESGGMYATDPPVLNTLPTVKVVPVTTNQAAVTAAPASGTNILLLAGLGLGAAYLLTRGSGGTIGGRGKSYTVPLLIVGGAAALWYFMSNNSSTAAAPAAAAQTPIVQATDQVVPTTPQAMLLARYTGQPKELAVINAGDPETLRRWALITTIWNAGASPYAFDVYGNPTTVRPSSIGVWWEQFSAQNGF
jgi:hypothetical protein